MSSELTHNPGQFDEVIHIIDNARSRAMKAVNAELIQMYWSVIERLKKSAAHQRQCRAYSDVLERRCVFVRALFCIKLWR